MSAPKTLRVRAAGTGLVQNHERLEASVNPANQFIGRRFEERKDRPGEMGFVATDEVEEVPYRAEYIHALRAGDLEPADEATAKAASLDFKTTNDRKPTPGSSGGAQ